VTRPWWKHYPRRYWTEVDWQAWEKAGKPKVPKDPILEKQGEPINPTVTPPAQTLPAGFSMFPKQSKRDARGRAVDQLLDQLGVRP
jgi:hypothetical protein